MAFENHDPQDKEDVVRRLYADEMFADDCELVYGNGPDKTGYRIGHVPVKAHVAIDKVLGSRLLLDLNRPLSDDEAFWLHRELSEVLEAQRIGPGVGRYVTFDATSSLRALKHAIFVFETTSPPFKPTRAPRDTPFKPPRKP